MIEYYFTAGISVENISSSFEQAWLHPQRSCDSGGPSLRPAPVRSVADQRAVVPPHGDLWPPPLGNHLLQTLHWGHFRITSKVMYYIITILVIAALPDLHTILHLIILLCHMSTWSYIPTLKYTSCVRQRVFCTLSCMWSTCSSMTGSQYNIPAI